MARDPSETTPPAVTTTTEVKKTSTETYEKRTTTTTFEKRTTTAGGAHSDARAAVVDVRQEQPPHAVNREVAAPAGQADGPGGDWHQQLPDRVRITVSGVESAGCPGAAELDGDYILDAVERHPDQCRWEVSFPAKCRFYRMGLAATRGRGVVTLRASLEGAFAGPEWIAEEARVPMSSIPLRFNRGTTPNPSSGCLWPETITFASISSAVPSLPVRTPSGIQTEAATAAGRYYISPEPSAWEMEAMAASSASSSGSCELTGIDPPNAMICMGSKLTFNAQGMDLEKVEWATNPAADPATGTGGSFTTQWTTSGAMKVTATCPGTSGKSKTANITVVEVKSITIVSGATQKNVINVIGAKNWAAVKSKDVVIAEVTLNPNTDAAAAAISWSGGSPVPGKPRQRQISKSTSVQINLKATCGTSSADLTLWVLWGTVTIEMTGTTPPNSAQFGNRYDKTEKLGVVTFDGGEEAAGKIAAIGKLTPVGVNQVVTGGWAFKRDVWSHAWMWANGFPGGVKKIANMWNDEWTDDTSEPQFLKLIPDSSDQIYDIDAPNVFGQSPITCLENYYNFCQWIAWNDILASDYVFWSWIGKWSATGVPEHVIVKKLAGTLINIPDAPQGCP